MRVSVITIVAGRHDHLRRQLAGIATGSRLPDGHVVVAMGDPAVRDVVRPGPVPTTVLDVEAGRRLPLAQARNLGAARALADGADVLVLLDVDCIPSPRLVERYAAAAGEYPDDLLCGPVSYLPPPGADGYPSTGLDLLAAPRAARPAPADGTTLRGEDHDLFWSLSFAVTAATWRAVGGFSEAYLGYGGEDTDFGRTARSRGVGLRWVGGADAFHQHHPVSSPPVEHLDDILVNARIFHDRWGTWPMLGWLRAFEQAGLVTYETAADKWIRKM